MTKPAAFQATVHGFRTVPSRGVVSLTIEAPIEQHAEIARIAVHGAWVAVARIQQPKEVMPNKPAPSGPNNDSPALSPEPTERGKKPWRGLPPSQQAAIRCNEPIFVAFLKEEHPDVLLYADQDAAQAVRDLCSVTSRSELNSDHQARALWTQLENQFQAWKATEHA